MTPLPPHLQTRVEEEFEKWRAFPEGYGSIRDIYRQGASALYAILTEVSGYDEIQIKALHEDFCHDFELALFTKGDLLVAMKEAYRFGLLSGEVKE